MDAKDGWRSDRSVAQGLLGRLKQHLPAREHGAVDELFRRTSEDELRSRGALFELKLLNSLTDESLARVSLNAKPDWFPPSQCEDGKDLDFVLANGLACELKSVRVPATNTAYLADHMTETQCRRALHGGINFGDTAETRMRALLETVEQRIKDKKLHLATRPVWLVMEAAPDTDWLRDDPSRLNASWVQLTEHSDVGASEVRLAVVICGETMASRVTVLPTHGTDDLHQMSLLQQSLRGEVGRPVWLANT